MGLKVITEPTVEPVTLAEAKLHCRVTGTDDDARITTMITAAREHAEQITGRSLAEQTLRLYLDAWPEYGDVELPRPPVTQINSVQYYDTAGALQSITSTNYALDDKRDQDVHWLLPADDYEWPDVNDVANAIIIEYEAGYTAENCPAAIKQYILASVAAMFDQAAALARSDRNPQPVKWIEGLLDRYRIVSV
jgi:uncharacterized phiE125 gp8 family phage protein